MGTNWNIVVGIWTLSTCSCKFLGILLHLLQKKKRGSKKHLGHSIGEGTQRTSSWLQFLFQFQFRSVSNVRFPTSCIFQLNIRGPLTTFSHPHHHRLSWPKYNVHSVVVSVIPLVPGYKNISISSAGDLYQACLLFWSLPDLKYFFLLFPEKICNEKICDSWVKICAPAVEIRSLHSLLFLAYFSPCWSYLF